VARFAEQIPTISHPGTWIGRSGFRVQPLRRCSSSATLPRWVGHTCRPATASIRRVTGRVNVGDVESTNSITESNGVNKQKGPAGKVYWEELKSCLRLFTNAPPTFELLTQVSVHVDY
jgi:hypothetical protein